nr:MAG TPA: hypothetical protein [Bacteriophage sp.]
MFFFVTLCVSALVYGAKIRNDCALRKRCVEIISGL